MGGMIRCVVNSNPAWYRKFCAQHLSVRKRRNVLPDTRVKRRNVEQLLERLCAGKPSRSYYVAELLHIAQSLPPETPDDEAPF